MIKINLENGCEISTLNDNGDGTIAITISENNIVKSMVSLNAIELAKLVKDLKEAYLSIAGF